jgi:hypothetical protein
MPRNRVHAVIGIPDVVTLFSAAWRHGRPSGGQGKDEITITLLGLVDTMLASPADAQAINTDARP